MVGYRRKYGSTIEWNERKQQMERIKGPRLHLSDEAVPGQSVGVPDRQAAVPDAGDRELHPGVTLVDRFAVRQKRKLAGQDDLPIEQRGHWKKEQQPTDGSPSLHDGTIVVGP